MLLNSDFRSRVLVCSHTFSVFQKLCSDAQVRVFGKCCQLKPGGDSSSSLDSSINSSSSFSDPKEQCPKYQVSHFSFFLHNPCQILMTGEVVNVLKCLKLEASGGEQFSVNIRLWF